jgi:hypothetical protein
MLYERTALAFGPGSSFFIKRVKPKLLKADIYNIGINEWEV